MRNEDLNPETQDSIQTQRRDERERGGSSNMSSFDLKSEAADRRGSKDWKKPSTV